MKEEKIWQMVDAMTDREFKVKDGVIRIVDPSHVCMMEIRNVKLKDGSWIMEGKGAKRKPVKSNQLYGNPPAMPKIDFPCKVSLGSLENIYKVCNHMEYFGGLCTIKSNGKTLEISNAKTIYNGNFIKAIIPTTNIDGDAHSQYAIHNLTPLFRYLNPTSLEFGENYPIKIKGKNWTYFLAPRND